MSLTKTEYRFQFWKFQHFVDNRAQKMDQNFKKKKKVKIRGRYQMKLNFNPNPNEVFTLKFL